MNEQTDNEQTANSRWQWDVDPVDDRLPRCALCGGPVLMLDINVWTHEDRKLNADHAPSTAGDSQVDVVLLLEIPAGVDRDVLTSALYAAVDSVSGVRVLDGLYLIDRAVGS